MSKKQHIGSHSRSSYRWDKQVPRMRGSRRRLQTPDGYSYVDGWTSNMRQVVKRMHNRKSRYQVKKLNPDD